MRISTASFYNASLIGIQNQQSQIAQLTRKVADNRSYLNPREAPIDNNRAMELSSSMALRKQYESNQLKAELALKHENVHLESLYDSLTKVRAAMMGVGGSNNQSLRDQIAIEVANLYATIKDLGNARDSGGNYIFSGYETDTPPISHTQAYPGAGPSAPAVYQPNDAGVRNVTIENGRQVATNDSLRNVFQGAGWDVLQDLDNAAIALRDNLASPAAVQASLDAAMSSVTNAIDQLRNTQTQVAGRLLEIDGVRGATKDLMLLEQNALGELTELDMAAAIVELQQRQTNLEASQRTYALVSRLSLFDYLG